MKLSFLVGELARILAKHGECEVATGRIPDIEVSGWQNRGWDVYTSDWSNRKFPDVQMRYKSLKAIEDEIHVQSY